MSLLPPFAVCGGHVLGHFLSQPRHDLPRESSQAYSADAAPCLCMLVLHCALWSLVLNCLTHTVGITPIWLLVFVPCDCVGIALIRYWTECWCYCYTIIIWLLAVFTMTILRWYCCDLIFNWMLVLLLHHYYMIVSSVHYDYTALVLLLVSWFGLAVRR